MSARHERGSIGEIPDSAADLVPRGVGRGLGAVAQPELRQHVAHVVLDGLRVMNSRSPISALDRPGGDQPRTSVSRFVSAPTPFGPVRIGRTERAQQRAGDVGVPSGRSAARSASSAAFAAATATSGRAVGEPGPAPAGSCASSIGSWAAAKPASAECRQPRASPCPPATQTRPLARRRRPRGTARAATRPGGQALGGAVGVRRRRPRRGGPRRAARAAGRSCSTRRRGNGVVRPGGGTAPADPGPAPSRRGPGAMRPACGPPPDAVRVPAASCGGLLQPALPEAQVRQADHAASVRATCRRRSAGSRLDELRLRLVPASGGGQDAAVVGAAESGDDVRRCDRARPAARIHWSALGTSLTSSHAQKNTQKIESTAASSITRRRRPRPGPRRSVHQALPRPDRSG